MTMAKLTSGQRSKLPSKDFAGPGRSFPVEDRAHAQAALRLVGRAVRAGHITQDQADKIKAMARAKLGK
jgi:hypothetical protein